MFITVNSAVLNIAIKDEVQTDAALMYTKFPLQKIIKLQSNRPQLKVI